MTVDTFTSDKAGNSGTLTAGSDSFSVGATLNVGRQPGHGHLHGHVRRPLRLPVSRVVRTSVLRGRPSGRPPFFLPAPVRHIRDAGVIPSISEPTYVVGELPTQAA